MDLYFLCVDGFWILVCWSGFGDYDRFESIRGRLCEAGILGIFPSKKDT